MLDTEELLERFGDEEFLHELWMKTRRQLPEALDGIEALIQAPQTDPDQLGSKLHRLRGLIANFLEGGESISSLRAMEAANRAEGATQEMWSGFSAQLEQESKKLDQWLESCGYPCP